MLLRIKTSYYIALTGVLFCLLNAACRKDQTMTTGGIIGFSVDTLTFDTVFTQQASFTNSFKIYNPQDEKIILNNVHMLSGASSYFRLNVDGFSGTNVSNITIQPHDSVYVFATVNIDPTNVNTPFVVEDDMSANLNGKNFTLHFMAYGQNAYYIVDSTLTTQTWKTDKPYVVIHSAEVASGETLTIPAGCKVYMHQDSWLFVLGTLKVNGTKTDTVVFQGDRLDRFYYDYIGYPGEWGGIYFSPMSKGSALSYTRLLNCGNSAGISFPTGIYVAFDSVKSTTAPQLSIDHTIIQNSNGYGILSLGGTIKASNCLVNSCNSWCMALAQGGNYTIDNCTFATYGSDIVGHTENGTIALLNYFDTSQTGYLKGDMNAVLTNCIVWGSLDTEIFCNSRIDAGIYNVTLNNCLIKGGLAPLQAQKVNVNNCIFAQDPKFLANDKFNFRLDIGSPAIDKGLNNGLINDLDGNPRPVGSGYDIGCYEKQ